jgi:predicted RNA-binding protein with PUA-like domain
MSTSYWLLKTEPSTYNFKQLLIDKKTNWNGVRNFQARNYLKQCHPGDLTFIYHSGDERSVIGIARITKPAYPDLDPKKSGAWVQIDLEAIRLLKHPVSLTQLKSNSHLNDLLLIKQSRLSVMPISATHYQIILKLGDSPTSEKR